MKLAIGYVHPGWVYEAFATSLRRYTTAFPDTIVIGGRSGSLLARARNDVTRAAVEQNIDVLLWLDTDMIFTNDDVNDLLDTLDDEIRIVGGLCLGIDYPTGELFTTCIPRLTSEECDGSIREVRGQGMGFCAMRIEAVKLVMETVDYPFGELYDEKLGWTDQDVGFTMRAAACGVKSFVHTGIRIGHIKEQVI